MEPRLLAAGQGAEDLVALVGEADETPYFAACSSLYRARCTRPSSQTGSSDS